jgi:hypothetical protein
VFADEGSGFFASMQHTVITLFSGMSWVSFVRCVVLCIIFSDWCCCSNAQRLDLGHAAVVCSVQ